MQSGLKTSSTQLLLLLISAKSYLQSPGFMPGCVHVDSAVFASLSDEACALISGKRVQSCERFIV